MNPTLSYNLHDLLDLLGSFIISNLFLSCPEQLYRVFCVGYFNLKKTSYSIFSIFLCSFFYFDVGTYLWFNCFNFFQSIQSVHKTLYRNDQFLVTNLSLGLGPTPIWVIDIFVFYSARSDQKVVRCVKQIIVLLADTHNQTNTSDQVIQQP